MTEIAARYRRRMRFCLGHALPVAGALLAAVAIVFLPVTSKADDSPPLVGSGLPVPRFVSLKSDRVNLRNGPGTDYPTGWVYRRAGLPVEVIKEFETWRQVRDSE
ncbi:MAG: SH3 domain-containing protein, partial [Hyphomicrobium sp.]